MGNPLCMWFRYVEGNGYGSYPVCWLSAEVINDEMQTIGHFSCSDTILNQVYNSTYWGIMSNYKGMPCPCLALALPCPLINSSHAERQPWLGDRTIGVFRRKVICLTTGLCIQNWMRDICEAQRDRMYVPVLHLHFGITIRIM